jgi:hypothetical protein
MRDYAAEAVELTRQRRREDLDDDRMLELALVRLMEIIGELPGASSRQHVRDCQISPDPTS